MITILRQAEGGVQLAERFLEHEMSKAILLQMAGEVRRNGCFPDKSRMSAIKDENRRLKRIEADRMKRDLAIPVFQMATRLRRSWETRRQAKTAILPDINGHHGPRRRHEVLACKMHLANERKMA